MKKFYKIICLTLIAVFASVLGSCSDTPENIVSSTSISPLASSYDAAFPREWMWLACKIVADESRDNPPQAGRVYSYSAITIYQCLLYGMPLNRSLSGQLKEMPPMPGINAAQEYDWPSVITGAMPVMLRGLFIDLYNPSHVMINNLYDRQRADRIALKNEAIVEASIQYGMQVAQRILQWANTDGYYRIKGVPYIPPSISQNPWNWEPINPGDTAVEPYWGTLRTFALPNAGYNDLPPSYTFDTTVGSDFYNDEIEIYNIRANPTQEQLEIALFWRDKQLTPQPPGHWVSIVNQIVLRDNMSLDRAAECYAMLGIGIEDAFIACWFSKYKYNYLRPQSYIRRFYEEGWTPLIPTPPFPDYPSGHSTASGTCAYLLTHLLGTVSFTDSTHTRIGMQPRSFNSFYDAAVECSNSRVYGNIHYRNACENGVIMGWSIGETIASRVNLRITYP